MSYIGLGFADQVLGGHVSIERAEDLGRPLEGARAPLGRASLDVNQTLRAVAPRAAAIAAGTAAIFLASGSVAVRRIALAAGAAGIILTAVSRRVMTPEVDSGWQPTRAVPSTDPYAPVAAPLNAADQAQNIIELIAIVEQRVSEGDLPDGELRLSQLRIAKRLFEVNGLPMDYTGRIDTQGNGVIVLVKDQYGYRIEGW